MRKKIRKLFFTAIIVIVLILATGGFVFAQTSADLNISGYFVEINVQSTGPYDATGLRHLISQGHLNRSTLVWKEGMSGWIAAGTVPELAPLLSAVPPPLPASQQAASQTQQTRDQVDGYRWYNSYAPGLRDNRVFFNAGVGLGPTRSYSMGIPPISASVDFKVTDVVPITVGATGMFSTWKWSGYNFDVTYRNIGIGARGMYHFNFARNLDVYTGLTLGWVIQTASGYSFQAVSGNSFFLWGGNVGVRYFFSDRLGVYSELGYSGLQFISAGLTMKF